MVIVFNFLHRVIEKIYYLLFDRSVYLLIGIVLVDKTEYTWENKLSEYLNNHDEGGAIWKTYMI